MIRIIRRLSPRVFFHEDECTGNIRVYANIGGVVVCDFSLSAKTLIFHCLICILVIVCFCVGSSRSSITCLHVPASSIAWSDLWAPQSEFILTHVAKTNNQGFGPLSSHSGRWWRCNSFSATFWASIQGDTSLDQSEAFVFFYYSSQTNRCDVSYSEFHRYSPIFNRLVKVEA